ERADALVGGADDGGRRCLVRGLVLREAGVAVRPEHLRLAELGAQVLEQVLEWRADVLLVALPVGLPPVAGVVGRQLLVEGHQSPTEPVEQHGIESTSQRLPEVRLFLAQDWLASNQCGARNPRLRASRR